jgi:predicted GNAT family N-acyltransferase
LFTIRQPKSEDEFRRYYQLRWLLLRAPWKQPKGSEIDEIEDQCYHLMAVDATDEIIAVARLQFNSDSEAQLRYMAVDSSHQGQGIGCELISAMESHAGIKGVNIIVLDARESAVGFYRKLGYSVVEKSYLLFDEIQHFRMSKEL